MSDFNRGALAAVAVLSLLQDGMGQERYMQMVETFWTPAWIGVPIALSMLVLALFIKEDSNEHTR